MKDFIRGLEIAHKLAVDEYVSTYSSYPSDSKHLTWWVAELLGVSPPTVNAWLRSGQLRGERVRGLWYIEHKSVIELAKVKGYYSTLTPGWYVSRGRRRYVISCDMHSRVQYGTPGGATRYCTPLEFIAWLKEDTK